MEIPNETKTECVQESLFSGHVDKHKPTKCKSNEFVLNFSIENLIYLYIFSNLI